MATNVEIDPELIKAALRLGGKRSKRAVIDEALREYVLRRQRRDVIKLFGSIDYDESYDYKKQRRFVKAAERFLTPNTCPSSAGHVRHGVWVAHEGP